VLFLLLIHSTFTLFIVHISAEHEDGASRWNGDWEWVDIEHYWRSGIISPASLSSSEWRPGRYWSSGSRRP